MLKVWKWYQSCLAHHPLKTQVISSGVLWGIGDIAAQYITHSTAMKRLQCSSLKVGLLAEALMLLPSVQASTHSPPLIICTEKNKALEKFNNLFQQEADKQFKINWKRVGITSMFGFGFVGPVGHFWYEGLDKFIRLRLQLQPRSARFVAAKVAMDGLIFGPFDLLVFFTYMGFSTGKDATQVKEDLRRDFLPALVLEGGIWPIVQVANFRYVPVRYQLLYVNIFCLLDSAFLSWVEQQKDAPWKQWFTSSFNSVKERGGQGRF